MERLPIIDAWREAVKHNAQNETIHTENGYYVSRGVDQYLRFLPSFIHHGIFSKDFLEVIDQKTKKGKTVDVLDLGCGDGQFLTEIKEKYGDMVTTWGISMHDFRTKENEPRIDHYTTVDAHKINFSKETFDVVVATQAFIYLADPLLIAQRIYSWLKEDGYAFLEGVNNDGFLGEPSSEGFITHRQFIDELRDLRFDISSGEFREHDIRRGNIAMRKKRGKPTLSIPVEYSGEVQDFFDLKKMEYAWIGTKPQE